jgi:hypothetical protein
VTSELESSSRRATTGLIPADWPLPTRRATPIQWSPPPLWMPAMRSRARLPSRDTATSITTRGENDDADTVA